MDKTEKIVKILAAVTSVFVAGAEFIKQANRFIENKNSTKNQNCKSQPQK